MLETQLPLPLLSSLLFTLMGPIALLPAFAAATRDAPPALRRRIALVAFAASLGAVSIAVFIGASTMQAWRTTPAALIVAAGVILALTALRNIFGTPSAPSANDGKQPPPSLTTGLTPIAIPGIVTPTGVAVLIIFVSYFPTMAEKIAIMGAVFAIMLANLGAMLAAHWFMRWIGIAPLIVLGAVFGVLQVAMGVEMIMSGLIRSRLIGG